MNTKEVLVKKISDQIGLLIFYFVVILLLLGQMSLFPIQFYEFENRKIGVIFLLTGFFFELIKFFCRNTLDKISSLDFFPLNLFFFFTFFSLVINPANITEQFGIYFFSFIAFYYGWFFFKTKNVEKGESVLKKLEIVFVCLGLFISLVSLSTAIFKFSALNILRTFVSEKMFIKLLFELNRGRIFPIIPADIIGVFTIATFIDLTKNGASPKKTRLLLLFSLLSLLTNTFSNYRSHIFSGIIGVLLLLKINKAWYLFRNLLLMFTFTIFLTTLLLPTNLIKRLMLSDKEDLINIQSRLHNFSLAVQIFKNYAILGIGAGNLPDFVGMETVKVTTKGETFIYQAYQHPHNYYALVLAENGLVGFFSFTLMIFCFVWSDLKLINKEQYNRQVVSLIVSSWVFLIGSALDWYPVHMIIFFFLTRGIIIGSSEKIFLQTTH